MNRTTTLLAVALLATLPLAGCVDSFKDDDKLDPTANGGTKTTVDVAPSAVQTEAGPIDELHLSAKRVLAHKAGGTDDDWVVLSDKAREVTVIEKGAAKTGTAGSGSLPQGSYDGILIELSKVSVTQASTEGNGTGGTPAATGVSIGAAVPFTVGTEEVRLVVVIDTANSQLGLATPIVLAKEVRLQKNGKDIGTLTPGNVNVPTAQTRPPVARISAFDPSGALVHKADFVAEDGAFINGVGNAYLPGDKLTFTGTESEVQVAGTDIKEFMWTFGDGTSESGGTVTHAWDRGGAFEVILTITDTRGVKDTHSVFVVVLPDEPTDRFVSFPFEDDASQWQAENGGNVLDTSAAGVSFTWDWIVGTGRSGNGYRTAGVALPTDDQVQPLAMMGTATLTSPSITLPKALRLGYSVDVMGVAGAAGSLPSLDMELLMGDEVIPLESFREAGEWTTFIDIAALDAHAGHPMRVRFVSTPAGPDLGGEWVIDNFEIVGIAPSSVVNGSMLVAKAGDGHDHAH